MTFQRLPQVPPMELSDELKETLTLLEAQGMCPQLCDTPVPYFDAGIPCGSPRDVYEATPDGYILVPRSLVGNDATVIARVTGDSMKDAGFEENDEIHVLLDANIHDGDVVVACIDGGCIVKSFLRDEEGQVWLVPCNDAYEPIRITEDMDAHIVGKVIAHRKPTPHTSYSYLQKAVRRTQTKREKAPTSYTPDEVKELLREVYGDKMAVAADWIAVYRVLVDKCDAPASLTAFADYINALGLDEYPACRRDSLRKVDPTYTRPLYEWSSMPPSAVLSRRTAIARHLRQLLEQ